MPGLALSSSESSSVPPNTGVTDVLGGDRPWGVTEPVGGGGTSIGFNIKQKPLINLSIIQ